MNTFWLCFVPLFVAVDAVGVLPMFLSLTDGLPGDVAALTGCELNKLIADETGVAGIPAGLAELDELPIRFTEVIDGTTADIEHATEQFLAALQQ